MVVLDRCGGGGSGGGIVRQLWRWLVAVVVISNLLLVVFVVKVLPVRETLHVYLFVNRVARCVCCESSPCKRDASFVLICEPCCSLCMLCSISVFVVTPVVVCLTK